MIKINDRYAEVVANRLIIGPNDWIMALTDFRGHEYSFYVPAKVLEVEHEPNRTMTHITVRLPRFLGNNGVRIFSIGPEGSIVLRIDNGPWWKRYLLKGFDATAAGITRRWL